MHMKSEHEVVKYKMDLVVALSTLATWEEKRLVEVGKQRLVSLQMSGHCQREGLFLEEAISQRKKALGRDDKEVMRKELEEIRKMLLESSDDQDGDFAEKTNTDDVEIIEVFERAPKETISKRRIKVEASCPETPPPSLPPTPSQDPEEIEVVDIIENNPINWSERKVKTEANSETPPPSAPPTPRTVPPPSSGPSTPRSSPMSEVAREYSIKTEPEIEIVVDDIEDLDQGMDQEGGVDQSLPFCRLCYITFTSHADQLPHEQQVCVFSQYLFLLKNISKGAQLRGGQTGAERRHDPVDPRGLLQQLRHLLLEVPHQEQCGLPPEGRTQGWC